MVKDKAEITETLSGGPKIPDVAGEPSGDVAAEQNEAAKGLGDQVTGADQQSSTRAADTVAERMDDASSSDATSSGFASPIN